MPIEFACSSCSKLLRVPDGSEGKPCQCPECKAVVTVPGAKVLTQTNAPAANMRSDSEDGKLRVECPSCKHVLVCEADLWGTRGQCRQCNHIFTIGTERDLKPAAVDLSDALVFSCPKCSQLFEGKPEMQGRKGKCHVCQAVFAIRLRKQYSNITPQETKPQPRSTTSQQSTRDSRSTELGGSVQPGTAVPKHSVAKEVRVASIAFTAADKPIRLTCGACKGVLEVPGSSGGLETICPFCEQLLKVPSRGTAALPAGRKQKSAASPTPTQTLPAASNSTTDPNLALWDELLPKNSLPSATDPLAGLSSPANPYASHYGAQSWEAPARKPGKHVSFQKTFKLLFERSFPACLLGFFQYLLAGLPIALMVGVSMLLGMILVASGIRLSPTAAAIVGAVLYVAILFCALFFMTAAMCCTCNIALHAIRKKRITSEVFFGGFDIAARMMLIVLGISLLSWGVMFATLFAFGAALGGLGAGQASEANSPQAPSLIALVMVMVIGIPVIGLPSLAICFTPFAMLDGQGLFEAVGTSFRMFFKNFLPIIGSTLVFMLGFTLFGAITCNIGSALLVGLPVFLFACMYVQAKA